MDQMKISGNRLFAFKAFYYFAIAILVLGMTSYPLEHLSQDDPSNQFSLVNDTADDDGQAHWQPFEPDDESESGLSVSDIPTFTPGWLLNSLSHTGEINNGFPSKLSLCILFCSLKISFC